MSRLGRLVKQVSPFGAELLSRAYNHVAHRKYRDLPISDVFADVYRRNHWNSKESISGPGSTLEQTERVRSWLPTLLNHLGARSMLDLPCGDFGWLSKAALPLDSYVGADIVEALVTQNRERYADASHRFEVLDVTSSTLPKVDLVFCRDCLVHLSYDAGLAGLKNVARSGSRWLLTTTFTTHSNFDITTGNWRPINLERAPYSLGPPLLVLNEGCTEGDGEYADKALALYDLAAVRSRLA